MYSKIISVIFVFSKTNSLFFSFMLVCWFTNISKQFLYKNTFPIYFFKKSLLVESIDEFLSKLLMDNCFPNTLFFPLQVSNNGVLKRKWPIRANCPTWKNSERKMLYSFIFNISLFDISLSYNKHVSTFHMCIKVFIISSCIIVNYSMLLENFNKKIVV